MHLLLCNISKFKTEDGRKVGGMWGDKLVDMYGNRFEKKVLAIFSNIYNKNIKCYLF